MVARLIVFVVKNTIGSVASDRTALLVHRIGHHVCGQSH